MPFSEEQRELIERHLYPDETAGEQPTATLKVTRRELRFLLQAIQYYHDTCCPTESSGAECAMLTWGEDVHSGAIETACAHNCQEWIKDLLSPEVLSQFPQRSQARR